MRLNSSSLQRNRWQQSIAIGIELLVEQYKKRFRIPENLNHYSGDAFQAAEKKFVKYCITNGCKQTGSFIRKKHDKRMR
jgi:hypothetical protein